MLRTLTAAAFFAGALLLTSQVGAQPDPEALFKKGDANKDGKLSQEEFLNLLAKGGKLKDNPERAKKLFEKLDANSKGFLTPDQFKKIADLGGKKTKDKIAAPAKDKSAGFNDTPTAEQIAFFEKKIRPVLVEKCFKCHSAGSEKVKGELFLDSRDGVRNGGESGAIIIPGNPDRSLLIKAIRFKDESTQMPPKAKLPDEVIADFEAWVKMGVPDPRDPASGGRNGPAHEIDIVRGRQFWAFQMPRRHQVPEIQNPQSKIQNEIDAFLLDALNKKGLAPVGLAERRTLIRRVHFDLIGLPPSPDEVEAFLADGSPQAFEKVVDRLLASPRFGERWGRHWLDLARFAETTGKTVNHTFPQAWRYRDYVIEAFNKDKPYDQFIKEQLAGDLLATDDPKLKAERIIATGFLAVGPKTLNERNGTQFELDVADEQIEATTQAFLGITAACARCHDHKFDPIPQKDYYALAGIFRSTETCYGTVRFINAQRVSPLLNLPKESAVSALAKLTQAERTRIEGQITSIQVGMKDFKADQQVQRLFASGQISLLQAKLAAYDSEGNPKLAAMGVRDKPIGASRPFQPKGGFAGFTFTGTRSIADSPVYIRGEVDKPGAVVPRGFLQVMSTAPAKIHSNESGRLELANWIASKNNPLTARVEVNRVWQHLFGRGLVPTPDNFGAAGQLPTNPALLDHLALSFIDNGWSVKQLIRGIVLSRAYQRDSKVDAKCFETDPENSLVWRMTPRRLDAEALRDAALAVSGLLDAKPPVGSFIARLGEGPAAGPRLGGSLQNAVNDPRNAQRSVYLPVVRDNMPEAMSLFDAADPSLVVAERPITSVPAQSLYLLNSPFMLRVAGAAADRLLKETTTDSERIRAAYLLFFGRPPVEKELKAAGEFIETYKEAAKKEKEPRRLIERETWAAFTQAMLGSAEFQYRK